MRPGWANGIPFDMVQDVKSQDFAQALRSLGRWFERQKRVLPWRDQPTLYRVWVSEIMLQQTQVVTVIPYFERFVARFPTVEALAAADEAEVMKHWAGLGYYSRARNLHRGARSIVAAGDFPRTREGWLEISGVGDYTAGAILSIALDQPEAILDGNVERVISRLRRVTRVAGDATYKRRLWRLSRAFVERGAALGVKPSVVNQALMELGATFCSPRSPKCDLCPLRAICRGARLGDAESFPPKKRKKEWLQVQEEMDCVIDAEGRCLLRLRGEGEWRAGLWDLPSSQGPVAGCEKVGVLETRYVVTRHKVTRTTHVWRVSPGWVASESGGDSALDGAGTRRWVSLTDPEVAIGSALKKTWQHVRERFEAELGGAGLRQGASVRP